MAKKLGLDPAADVNNCSWSGSTVCGNTLSTTRAKCACSNRRITDLAARGYNPDIIIIFISCNDWAGAASGSEVPSQGTCAVGTWNIESALPTEPIEENQPLQLFREAYAIMLDKIHIAYPSARVFCCTNIDDVARDANPNYPSNNQFNVTVNSWNNNIKEIAEALGCTVIDLHSCGLNYANITSMAVDTGLHPNAAGHEMIASKIAAQLFANF